MLLRFFFRLFVKGFRKQILRDAYRGILGREPDAAGLAAYAAGLSRTGELAPILAEMAASDEHWRKMVRDRAATLAEQLQASLRDEPSDPDELARCADQIQASAEVGTCAAALSRGPGHWRQMARNDPGALVKAVFQGLLGREPDAAGAAAYEAVLGETGDIVSFLAAVADSEEHRVRLSGPAAGAGDAGTSAGLFAAADVVAGAFRGLLGRDPDEEGLIAYTSVLTHHGDIAALLADISRSAEHRKRVLLQHG